ncbi:type VI secretion system tip protein TssI/VgrG [Sorangium sp. So ce302]|uniref:type VI secretion system Vgr family protein n=1 Tax=Sorangium sp. So ce302 TaxID=3133297 RepID=UPI003F6369FE
MSGVALTIEGDPDLSPSRVRGVERLGEASAFEIDLHGPRDALVAPGSVLRKAGRLALDAPTGSRTFLGVVTRFAVIASDHEHLRAYRLTLASRFALLALTRRARTFQEMTAPEIVEQVVRGGGYRTERKRLATSYPKRRYVVQYQESDAAFVRRICEEYGLYFRFEDDGEGEVFILEDDSASAEDAYPGGVALVTRSTLDEPGPVAVDAARRLRRAVGKVVLRDHNPDQPRLSLEAEASGGVEAERDVEVYEAPGGFASPAEGAARARIRLESLRAEAARLSFDSNALALSPGARCRLVEAPDHHGVVQAAGDCVVTDVALRWDASDGVLRASVGAIPASVPFRLPKVTPRPRIAGVQSAWVTGERGQEIHPDALGRVHLRFHWDLHGEGDQRSSLPVRVAQPHLPDPMLLPRVGWEVFVMFEDGDPDRPVVLGRSYNEKQRPPLALPANKTVTSIATDSSPGAGARTAIQMDDAAGREHVLVHAPFAKETTVGGDHEAQTLKNEDLQVGAALQAEVGGDESTSVHLGYIGGYGSRSVTVGAAQRQSAGGNFVSEVGAETAVVGGMLVEQAGNPVKGAANLAASALLSKVSARGAAGQIAASAMGASRAAYEGYQAKGAEGALAAIKDSAAGSAMSLLPGGEAILAAVKGSSSPMPWDHGRPAQGEAAPGGGAAGASGAGGGPAGPGPGHRSVVASGSYTETVGALYALTTPGPVSWVTAGPATTVINGSHTSSAASAGLQVGGGLGEWLGSLNIGSRGAITRSVAGAMTSDVKGALRISAGGSYTLTAKSALTLEVSGNLKLGGSPITFRCGASEISATPAGVTIKSPSITITGSSKQSGSLTHR